MDFALFVETQKMTEPIEQKYLEAIGYATSAEGDPSYRFQQIVRSHASARPKPENPAWLNTHNDLDYILRVTFELAAAMSSLLGEVDYGKENPGRKIGNARAALKLVNPA